MIPVNVPWTDVNSETALVVGWSVADRAAVRNGTDLVEVETSKASLAIEAPADGFVLQLIPAGREVLIGQPIGLVFPTEDALAAYAARTPSPQDPAGAADGIRATAKARQRAAELGVDLADISRRGLITVKDVEAAAPVPGRPTSGEALPDLLRVPSGTRRLVLVGAGLGATQVLDILGADGQTRGVGIVDDNPAAWGRDVEGVPVVGGTGRVAELWEGQAFDAAVITISSSVEARAKLRALCRTAGVPLVNVVDPTAKIADGVTMGTGNVICAFVHIGTGTVVGDNNFISAYNSYDHHNVLGSDISTGPGCMTSGEVRIEDRVRLGTGIFIEPKLTVGEGSVVASGAIIVRSVPAAHAVKTKVVTTTVVPLSGR